MASLDGVPLPCVQICVAEERAHAGEDFIVAKDDRQEQVTGPVASLPAGVYAAASVDAAFSQQEPTPDSLAAPSAAVQPAAYPASQTVPDVCVDVGMPATEAVAASGPPSEAEAVIAAGLATTDAAVATLATTVAATAPATTTTEAGQMHPQDHNGLEDGIQHM